MSLKGFHFVFITISLLLCGFMTAWGMFLAETKDAASIATSASGTVGILILPWYARYFLRKANRIQC